MNCSKFPMVFFGHRVLGLVTDVAVPGMQPESSSECILLSDCHMPSVWQHLRGLRSVQGTQNLKSQPIDITFVFKRATDYQREQSHRIILWWIVSILIFFFLLHNTLKIFADLIPDSSCSGRTLTGRMRASACSASKVLYGQSHRHAEG